MNTNRIQWVDFAKLLVMAMVIFNHLGIENDYVRSWVSSFHVPAFFLLSGLFAHVKGTWAQSLKNDFLRLLLPVILWHIIGMFTWSPFQMHYMHPTDFWDAYLGNQLDFITGITFDFGWFMLALFWMRIEFRLLSRLPIAAHAFIGCIVFPLIAYALLRETIIPRYFLLNSLFSYLFYFVGFCFKKAILRRKSVLTQAITPPLIPHHYDSSFAD